MSTRDREAHGVDAPATAGASRDEPQHGGVRRERLAVQLVMGALFGLVLVKSEAVSWFRIQEMFRFQGFHMYGILGSAVVTAGLLLALVRRLDVRGPRGQPLTPENKEFVRGYSQMLGGTIFGLGWALLGACPGPIYALIGYGVTAMVVALLSAVAGAWTYGQLRPRLPH